MHSILDILFTTIKRWITWVDLRIAKETLLRNEPQCKIVSQWPSTIGLRLSEICQVQVPSVIENQFVELDLSQDYSL